MALPYRQTATTAPDYTSLLLDTAGMYDTQPTDIQQTTPTNIPPPPEPEAPPLESYSPMTQEYERRRRQQAGRGALYPILGLLGMATGGEDPSKWMEPGFQAQMEGERSLGQYARLASQEQREQEERLRKQRQQQEWQEGVGELDLSDPGDLQTLTQMSLQQNPAQALTYLRDLMSSSSKGDDFENWRRKKDYEFFLSQQEPEDEMERLRKKKLKLDIAKAAQAADDATGAGPGKRLSPTQVFRLADFDSSLMQVEEMVNGLENPETPTGPMAKLRGLNPLDVEAQGAKQLVAATKQLVGKALEGGVLRKEDEAKYAKILPKESDTLPVIRRKAMQIKTMLENSYKAHIGALERSGYNVSGYRSEGSYLNPVKLQSVEQWRSAPSGTFFIDSNGKIKAKP